MAKNPAASLSPYQKVTIVALLLPNVLDGASFSIIEPFFPIEAQRKGVGSATSGCIFAVYGLIQFIACPLLGKYIPKIGARNMYLAGMSTSAIGIQMFGILVRLSNTNLFVMLTFIFRIIESLGAAARETAVFTICAHLFPERTGLVTSLSETSIAIGFAAGPAVGGLLYEVGGYELPFLVLGGSVIFGVVISIFILPKKVKGHQYQECFSILEVISIWWTWPIIGTTLLASSGFAFLEPTLGVHLQQFYLSPLHIGMFFMISSSIYVLVTPLVGYFIDKTDMSRAVILIGFTLTGIGYLLIGPAPMLQLPSKLWITFIGSCIIQLGWSFSLISPFQDLLLSLNLVIGPSISGVLVATFDFPTACTVMSLLDILLVIFLGIFSVFEVNYATGYPNQFINQEKYHLLNTELSRKSSFNEETEF